MRKLGFAVAIAMVTAAHADPLEDLRQTQRMYSGPHDITALIVREPYRFAMCDPELREQQPGDVVAELIRACTEAARFGQLKRAARAYDPRQASDPEALGFSSSRLARIEAWQQAQVDAGAFSGAVAAIARNGKVAYLRAVGFRDRAKTVQLQPDAIFWIASATKPITSVAAMMLVENGKVDLAAPVHQ